MLWWFAETTLVAVILAATAALCGRLCTISSTTRHLLWLVVLIKLITPPIIQSPWSLPLPVGFWNELGTGEVAPPVSSIPTAPAAAELGSSESCKGPAQDSSQAMISDDCLALVPRTAHEPESAYAPEPGAATSMWRLLPSSWDVGKYSTQNVVLWVWVLGTVVLALMQGSRILCFRRRLLHAVRGPGLAGRGSGTAW